MKVSTLAVLASLLAILAVTVFMYVHIETVPSTAKEMVTVAVGNYIACVTNKANVCTDRFEGRTYFLPPS